MGIGVLLKVLDKMIHYLLVFLLIYNEVSSRMSKALYKQAGLHLKKKCRKLDETVKGIKLAD